jgi:post-segregation antitoxin (ccd killing protein)
MNYNTISAKIRPDLKKKLEKYKINVSELIRNAVENEIQLRENERFKTNLKNIQKILKNIPSDKTIAMIREDRES